MHMYCLVRGEQDHVNRWLHDVSAQYFPFTFEKDKPQGILQLAVRPIQLFELVFPEEQLKEVVRTVNPFAKHNPYLSEALRRLLKLDKMKLKDKDVEHLPQRVFTQQWVSVGCIGLKKDGRDANGVETI